MSKLMDGNGWTGGHGVNRTHLEHTEDNDDKIQTVDHIHFPLRLNIDINYHFLQTHHSAPLQTLYHSRCDEEDFSCLMD